MGYKKRTITVYVKPTTYRRGGKIVHRKGYKYVRADLGKPGKGDKVIPIKKKGALVKYGYSIHKSAEVRRRALAKAVEEYGALSVYRKLMAQAIFRKRYAPDVAERFRSDAEWVKSRYSVDGFAS